MQLFCGELEEARTTIKRLEKPVPGENNDERISRMHYMYGQLKHYAAFIEKNNLLYSYVIQDLPYCEKMQDYFTLKDDYNWLSRDEWVRGNKKAAQKYATKLAAVLEHFTGYNDDFKIDWDAVIAASMDTFNLVELPQLAIKQTTLFPDIFNLKDQQAPFQKNVYLASLQRAIAFAKLGDNRRSLERLKAVQDYAIRTDAPKQYLELPKLDLLRRPKSVI